MKKSICGILFSLLTIGYVNADVQQSQMGANRSLQPTKVGGWYPVFFNDFDSNKLNDIIERNKNGNIASINIIYDQNTSLAMQINNYLSSKGIKANLTQEKTKDTPTVQYNHEQVVLNIYSK